MILQECVCGFDHETFCAMLAPRYVCSAMSFSPVDLGHPSRRARKYCVCVKRNKFSLAVPWSQPTLERIFSRKCIADASIYFKAPSILVNMRLEEFIGNRVSKTDCAPLTFRDALCEHSRLRLHEHEEVAQIRGLRFLCSDITQSIKFTTMDVCVPCLLTNSLIWGRSMTSDTPKIDRIMLEVERLAALGWPVLLEAKHPLTMLLPMMFKFGVISQGFGVPTAALNMMCGNSMHLAQIGLVWAFVLTCLRDGPGDSRSHEGLPSPPCGSESRKRKKGDEPS